MAKARLVIEAPRLFEIAERFQLAIDASDCEHPRYLDSAADVIDLITPSVHLVNEVLNDVKGDLAEERNEPDHASSVDDDGPLLEACKQAEFWLTEEARLGGLQTEPAEILRTLRHAIKEASSKARRPSKELNRRRG